MTLAEYEASNCTRGPKSDQTVLMSVPFKKSVHISVMLMHPPSPDFHRIEGFQTSCSPYGSLSSHGLIFRIYPLK